MLSENKCTKEKGHSPPRSACCRDIDATSSEAVSERFTKDVFDVQFKFIYYVHTLLYDGRELFIKFNWCNTLLFQCLINKISICNDHITYIHNEFVCLLRRTYKVTFHFKPENKYC